MSLKQILTFSFFSTIFQVVAQTSVYEQPIYFSQFFNDLQVNSNNFKSNEIAIFSLGHKRNSNNFGGVNTSFFSALYNLDKTKENRKSVIGLQFINDKEGFLIRRNRFTPSYTHHIKVSPSLNLAGGIGVGFYNFVIKADEAFEGATAYALDASFLLKLYSPKLNIQFSVNQATNSKVVPVQQEIILGRNFNLFTSYRFQLDDQFEIVPSILNRYSRDQNTPYSGYLFAIGSHFIFNKIVSTGLSFEYENGFNFFAGLNDFKVGNSVINFELSYFVPSSKSLRTNVQMFELTLKYRLNRKKD